MLTSFYGRTEGTPATSTAVSTTTAAAATASNAARRGRNGEGGKRSDGGKGRGETGIVGSAAIDATVTTTSCGSGFALAGNPLPQSESPANGQCAPVTEAYLGEMFCFVFVCASDCLISLPALKCKKINLAEIREAWFCFLRWGWVRIDGGC